MADVAGVLHVAAVDREGGQTLLVVRRQRRREIDRAGPLGAVEAPDRLRPQRVHVDGLAAVAPARRHRHRRADVRAGELGFAGGGFRHAGDAWCRRSRTPPLRRPGGAAWPTAAPRCGAPSPSSALPAIRARHWRRPSMIGRTPILGKELVISWIFLLTWSRFHPVCRRASRPALSRRTPCARFSLYAPPIERYFELALYSARLAARKGEDVSPGRFVAADAAAACRHCEIGV